MREKEWPPGSFGMEAGGREGRTHLSQEEAEPLPVGRRKERINA